MSIEINELIVNATLEETKSGDHHQVQDLQYANLEDMKAQIISEVKELFYELLEKKGDR